MDKENILYYQSNIKTSRDENSVYAMKYANQQMLIDKLEQQCKKQKEVIDNVINIINQHFKHHPELLTENQIEYELIRKIENILKEVSE